MGNKFSLFVRELQQYYKNSLYYGFVRGQDYLEDSQLELIKNQIGQSCNDILNDFEEQFSSNVGSGYAVSFAAGRMGFYSLMKTLGIEAGDEIILLGHTCSVMPNAVLRLGATPIYADIDPITFGSSSNQIKKVITSRTKLFVAQHSYGIPCNIEPIVELAKQKGIFLLEDCAIAMGSKVKNIQVGNFGDAALFSIDHSKPINGFSGGLIYTKDNKLYKKLKEIQISSSDLSKDRQQAIWDKLIFERKYYNPKYYSRSFIINKIRKYLFWEKDSYLCDDYEKNPSTKYPYPAKLPVFLAQLGIFELNRWKLQKKMRKELLKSFLKLSESIGLNEYLPAPYFDKNIDIIPLRFVYTYKNATDIKQKMSKFMDIEWFWFNKPIIGCSDPRDLGYIYGSCPISENAGKEIINWPCVFDESDNLLLLKYFERIHA